MFRLNIISNILKGRKDINIIIVIKEINSFILHKIATMKIVCFTLITTLLLSSCITKDDYIRDVYVNIDLDLSLPEYSDLEA